MAQGGVLAPARARIAPPPARAWGGRIPPWSGSAWAAIAATALFVAITCWWLSEDGGVPFADAGSHLFTVVAYHDLLARGELAELWTRSGYYPPLTFLVGAIGTFVGGVNGVAPVIAQNVVYVSLLALGCYGTARIVGGPRAGFLAVIFALGSPLLIEQFHVFMIDAPEAAMVAVTVWLLLMTERFRRPRMSALAGLVMGLGLSSKEQFPLFVAGVLLVMVARGGWRQWRGLAVLSLVTLAVAIPWYAINWEQLDSYARAALANANLPARGKPPLLSISNLGWYFWAILNGLLFAPLFCFAVVGVAHAVKALAAARRKLPPADVRPELLGGLAVGWLGITLTPHHDMRYTMPLIVFLAVLGTSWIAASTRLRRLAASGLALAVVATTLGATFGVGGQLRIPLAGRFIVTDTTLGIPPPNQITVYADRDFVISAPRDGDVRRLFERIKVERYVGVGWIREQAPVGDPMFDLQGLQLLARFVGLDAPPLDLARPWNVQVPGRVLLVRRPLEGGTGPCITLDDQTGVWVYVDRGRRVHCPSGMQG